MFDQPQPCIVELFGHSVIAGRVSEQTVGGQSFVRIDVPEVDDTKAFTKFYGPGAIYAMTPVDEPTMLAAVRGYQVRPIEVFRLVQPAGPERLADDTRTLLNEIADFEDDDFDDDDDVAEPPRARREPRF